MLLDNILNWLKRLANTSSTVDVISSASTVVLCIDEKTIFVLSNIRNNYTDMYIGLATRILCIFNDINTRHNRDHVFGLAKIIKFILVVV